MILPKNRLKIIFLRIVRPFEFRVKGSMLSGAERHVLISLSFPGGWNPVKRYPNRTVTGTCPVVRGPDDEPEIGSQGSECESPDVAANLVLKRLNSPRRSTFAPRI